MAVTRAKHFMWIVGNQRALARNEVWGSLVGQTQLRLKFDKLEQTSEALLAKSLRSGHIESSIDQKRRDTKLSDQDGE